jgi:hypothetical protein
MMDVYCQADEQMTRMIEANSESTACCLGRVGFQTEVGFTPEQPREDRLCAACIGPMLRALTIGNGGGRFVAAIENPGRLGWCIAHAWSWPRMDTYLC